MKSLAGKNIWVGGTTGNSITNTISTQSSAITIPGTLSVRGFTAPSIYGDVRARSYITTITEEDFKSEVFKTPIESLVTLWIAKFGSNAEGFVAVHPDDLEDPFWRLVAVRLQTLSRLEIYLMADEALMARVVE